MPDGLRGRGVPRRSLRRCDLRRAAGIDLRRPEHAAYVRDGWNMRRRRLHLCAD
jgi:hypothetical protein